MPDEAIILLAEDMDDDAFLCQRALKKVALNHRCIHVSNGEECIAYLEGTGPYSNRAKYPLPNLLLLDLKMPILSGFEVLDWLCKRPEFKRLPVIILSGSEWQEDRERALRHGAREYQVKPMETGDLVTIMQAISSRWLKPPAGI
jgi:CheY-like chemotaxis protein